ncbi:MAG: sigma-54 dependent transcriptional regulator [Thermoanaerobaculia bacterium]|nr:sigma-54 dependent transcriptional regulator [Thermoanaerobaculia bacterium]
MKHRVLIVEDEPAVRRAVRRHLEREGFEVVEAATILQGEVAFRSERPDAAVFDYNLPDGTATDLLRALDPRALGVPVVVLTGEGTIDLAVQCMQDGAESFLTKPPEMETLTGILQRALETRRIYRRAVAAERKELAPGELDPFVGTSSAIRRFEEDARLVAESDASVLILGETGSGKGVLARWLHAQGPRSQEAFIDLNCAGLSRELLESELFGHARGAFTGAVAEKQGLMEVAHRGTLFLDEIGDMDIMVQPKFLTAIEEQRFRRLGDIKDRSVDVRLISATHRHLAKRVEEGVFRADLYYRVNTVILEAPALRERPEDIGEIADSLLRRLAKDLSESPPTLTREAKELLAGQSWPGNIRELRNVLERALLESRGAEVKRKHLRLHVGAGTPPLSVHPAPMASLADLERTHIESVLEQVRGSVDKAAKQLEIPRSTLYQKLKVFGIDPSHFRA